MKTIQLTEQELIFLNNQIGAVKDLRNRAPFDTSEEDLRILNKLADKLELANKSKYDPRSAINLLNRAKIELVENQHEAMAEDIDDIIEKFNYGGYND